MGVADNNQVSFYLYDAAGERTVKFTGNNQWIDVNGVPQGYAGADKLTLYASPYLVASSGQYTKHYYAGEQRILSKIGGGGLGNYNAGIIAQETHRKKVAILENMVRFIGNTLYLKTLSVKPKSSVPCNQEGMLVDLCNYRNIVHQEEDRYFYHPDHLGSSSWITDRDGMPMQHLAYLPFGEEFVDQKTSNWSAAYKFTGKEKDEETGYNYFGARYYMSDLGIWGSVDPLSDKYPSISAFAYCGNNPIILVDPNGKEIVIYNSNRTERITYLPGMEYNDDPYISAVVNDLNKLYEKSKGKEMIDALVLDPNFIGISSYTANRQSNGYSSLHVYYDPFKQEKRTYAQGASWSLENFIRLAHELAHAWDDILGTKDDSEWYTSQNGEVVRKGEIFACNIENLIRAEQGLSLRTHYSFIHVTGSGYNHWVGEEKGRLNNGTSDSTPSSRTKEGQQKKSDKYTRSFPYTNREN